jgi:SAM-dependent MidA family methyltransferase
MRQCHEPESELTRLIRREIQEAGPLSFARFMELALYHPIHGYYESSCKQIGCQGDFYTSVSVGPLFGELLAFQFDQWLSELFTPPAVASDCSHLNVPFQLVEAGAHDGQLARDILAWFQKQRPDSWSRIEYWIIEKSQWRRQIQGQTLREFGTKVHWAVDWNDLRDGVCGVIFSNELMDALPVVRLGWDAAKGEWFEWRVTLENDRFAWCRGPAGSFEIAEWLNGACLAELPEKLLALLPDGFTTEICPAAVEWWARAAAALKAGRLLTFDYGLEAVEFLEPQRKDGTLRTYSGHQPGADPLTNAGQQDLTAHVNFTALQAAGEKAGLRTELYSEQGRFLARIVEKVFQDSPRFGLWGEASTRQFQTLAHPAHLGRAFRVLAQSRLAI